MGKAVYKAPKRVDRLNSEDVQEELQALVNDGVDDLSFDMSDTGYMSSAGLRVLVTMQKELTAKGGRFTVLNVAPAIREVLDVTGLSSVMNIE
ncbi:MAG: STAS domain-containing protein [Lachnospiraceae bacterium]|nr:STAS domain-containing protein [Lachnospiraceae bacterium]